MSDAVLWQAVADLVQELPAAHVERLARRVEGGSAQGALGRRRHAGDVESALYDAWAASPVPGVVLAGALRGALSTAEAQRRREAVELVWTGPTSAVPIRRTEAVLVQVLREARERVVLVSFVAYEVPSVTEALREAVSRGVHVEIVLEATTTSGGRVDVDSVAKMRTAVPQASIYVWDEPPDDRGFRGAVHAKCVVADGTVAFITSANLTSAAMWRNMELGVLIRGGRQPLRLTAHIQWLKDAKVLKNAD